MQNPLPFLVAGSVNGAVYGLAGVGLVFAYRLSRTLNFAHGAIAMVAAFSYWQFREASGWPAPLAMLVAIVLIPTALALTTERLVFRPLADATIFAKTSATIGLLLTLYGFGTYQWGDDFVQVPNLFPNTLVHLPGVVVSGRQVGVVATSLALTGATMAFLRYSAVGLRIRAVVDRPAVAALWGIDAAAASRVGWIASYLLAAVSGLLLAPLQGGGPIQLTLVVVFSLVAAAIGRMVSLPMTLAGGFMLGIGDALLLGYLPQGQTASYARGLLPMGLLFGVLVVRARSLTDSDIGETGAKAMLADLGAITSRIRSEPAWRPALATSLAVLALAAAMGDFWTSVFAAGVGHAIIFLSYVVFTSTTGLVSLAQGAFAGVGAFSAAILLVDRGWPWPAAVLAGGGAAAATGAVVALPTVRLRGVFLALATIAFAQLVEGTLYPLLFLSDTTEGGHGGRPFDRPWGFDGPVAYLGLLLLVFFALAVGVTAFRRSAIGRALQADLWAPAGAKAVGVRPERGRLVAFIVAAFVAGIGGALLSGVGQFVDVWRWNLINAFIWLALVAIGGVGSIWGALLAAGMFVLTPEIVRDIDPLNDLYIAGFGALGLLLMRRPGGLMALLRRSGGRRAPWQRPLSVLPPLTGQVLVAGADRGIAVALPKLQVTPGLAAVLNTRTAVPPTEDKPTADDELAAGPSTNGHRNGVQEPRRPKRAAPLRATTASTNPPQTRRTP